MKKNDGKIDLNLSLPIIFSTFARFYRAHLDGACRSERNKENKHTTRKELFDKEVWIVVTKSVNNLVNKLVTKLVPQFKMVV